MTRRICIVWTSDTNRSDARTYVSSWGKPFAVLAFYLRHISVVQAGPGLGQEGDNNAGAPLVDP